MVLWSVYVSIHVLCVCRGRNMSQLLCSCMSLTCHTEARYLTGGGLICRNYYTAVCR